MDDAAYATERDRMVDEQIAERGVRDARVLEAMRSMPRHVFVEPRYQAYAYTDGPLPIGNGQTISQPYIVALMTELLALRGDENVLEVGTGSGYQAAVLATLTRQVHTIERFEDLAGHAARILKDLGLSNVQVHTGDGSLGLAEFAPYDAILVAAAAPWPPKALLSQMADGGRLVIPIGARGGNQVLERWERHGERLEFDQIIPVAFVPLVGEQGWKD